MLDAFIIEEIKRRERDKGAEEQRPVVELPLPPPPPAPARRDDDEGPRDDRDRGGVVIIDYTG
jgi:hypothetical protein